MAEVHDIGLNEDGSPCIANGDFVISESTEQHQQHLLISEKGNFKEFPFLGVGAINYLLDDGDINAFKKEITKQFELDGMTVNRIILSDKGNLIDAEY